MRTGLLSLVVFLGIPAIGMAKEITLEQRLVPAIDGIAEQKQYVSEKRVITDGPLMRTIVDGESKTVTIADKEKKVHTVIPFETLRTQLESSLARKTEGPLPPNARAALEAKLGHPAQRAIDTMPITVKPTGRSDKIAGHETQEFVLEGGTVSGTIWVAKDIAVPRELIEIANARVSSGTNAARLARAFGTIEGFPVKSEITIAFDQTKVTRSVTTVSATEGKTPLDVTKPPAGSKKLELDSFLAAISS